MGLKKRSRVSAEFSMSSLTDIIFLLLIFFMLTSSLVSPHSVNIKLPGTSGNPTVSNSKPPVIEVSNSGKVTFQGRSVKEPIRSNLGRILSAESGGRSDFDVILRARSNAPTDQVVAVMDVTQKLGIEPILATSK